MTHSTYIVFYDAENYYVADVETEEEAAQLAREDRGEGWKYIERLTEEDASLYRPSERDADSKVAAQRVEP